MTEPESTTSEATSEATTPEPYQPPRTAETAGTSNLEMKAILESIQGIPEATARAISEVLTNHRPDPPAAAAKETATDDDDSEAEKEKPTPKPRTKAAKESPPNKRDENVGPLVKMWFG